MTSRHYYFVSIAIAMMFSFWMGYTAASNHAKLFPPTCTPEEIAQVDALVIERNGAEIGDVSESERRGFGRDYYNCQHPNIDWRFL